MTESTEERKKDWGVIALTPIWEAEDGTNNYSEFKLKSKLELDAAGYWKYIEGAEHDTPSIPKLQPAREVQELDSTGARITVRIPGNEAEVKAAQKRVRSWLDGDKKALAIIVKAVPMEKLYLVEDCTSARAAWKALKTEYEPSNPILTLTILQRIIGNQCQPGDDPVAWLEVMIRLYSRLRDADPKIMPDWDFAKHLIMLMTRDEKWRYCRDELRNRLRIAAASGSTLSSQFVIRRLKEEGIEQGIGPSVASINAIMATGRNRPRGATSEVEVEPAALETFPSLDNVAASRQQARHNRRPRPYPSLRPPN
ncbi:hypothetical protein C8R42DRAFT_458324 [Lentinula raphanica]|nr:hypothetical protein C8R42DRAFT_458324 [Lentinula raphanica]